MPEPAVLSPALLAGLLLLAATAPVRAQAPPGAPMPASVDQLDRAPVEGDPAHARFRLGQDARKQNDLPTARQHLLSALEFHPASSVVLQELVLASADDPGLRAHFTERLLRGLTDKDGRARIDAALRRTLPKEELALWERLSQTRAAAAAELAHAAGRLKDGKGSLGNGAVARLYAELGHELMADAPHLLRAHGAAFQQACERQVPDYESVLSALGRLMQRTPTVTEAPRGDGELPDPQAEVAWQRQQEQSIRAARILAGLGQQAGQKDRKGAAPPALGDLPGIAAQARDRLQAEAQQRVGRVWTIAELRALEPGARSDFTLAHRQWSAPGIALSPNARYRIETVCGHETLLGAAETVELHHRRLVDHYGSDPFRDRPGTVRIVPEHSELEAEGAPFWWAGGFQSGDRTVVRFAWSNLPAMGRVLTHELTHRFDGVIFPFQPGWLVEGHATWTGGAYGQMADDHFADRHLDIGSCVQAYTKGYGRARELARLIEGGIDDYRDNYPAGCALYTFLRTWPIEGEPKYRTRLDEFRKNGRAGVGKPLEFFTRLFCDGKEARPASLEAFAREFDFFLEGIWRWTDRQRDEANRWIGRYQLDLGPGDTAAMVPDEPTWTWARTRAEPFFGQDHATLAGALLAEIGATEAAAAAWLWSLQVDGWRERAAAPLPGLLRTLGRTEAAFAVASLGRARFPAVAVPDPAPMLPSLPRLRGHLDQLEKCTAAAVAAGQGRAVDSLRRERARLCRWLGLQVPAVEASPALPRLLGGFGWTEDSLNGFDDRRVEGLWFVTQELDLHVGRERPRDATGLRDRASHRRDAFVRTVEWPEPGDYVLRARIHFTTAFAEGAVVLGHVRRDRGLRLHFRAGDWSYAVGRREQDHQSRKVWIELQGLWERDAHLPQSHPACEHEMQNDAAGLAVEVHVRGPSVLVMIDGEAVMRYATHDAAPIEGPIGFATSMGAIRVQQPTLQRLEPEAAIGGSRLDLSQPVQARAAEDLLLRPLVGVPPAACGTLLVWIPPTEDIEVQLLRTQRLLPHLAGMLADPLQYPQALSLCVPVGLPEAGIERLRAAFRSAGARELPVLRHAWSRPFTGDPWVVFVDEPGLLRAAAQIGDVHLHTRVLRWARLFRRR